MNYLDYEVGDMLKALDGYDTDKIIKIKLADGTVLPIAGMQFRSACIGGDDILYIAELDPLWIKYHKEVEIIAYHLYKTARRLKCAIEAKGVDDIEWALDCIMKIAEECDYWLKELKIEHDFDPLTGSDWEVFDKIELLKKWVKSY